MEGRTLDVPPIYFSRGPLFLLLLLLLLLLLVPLISLFQSKGEEEEGRNLQKPVMMGSDKGGDDEIGSDSWVHTEQFFARQIAQRSPTFRFPNHHHRALLKRDALTCPNGHTFLLMRTGLLRYGVCKIETV